MKNEIHGVSLGLLALLTLGGCASFNDHYYEKTQRFRAAKEYVHCGQPESAEYPHDYKKGWIDGFYEVATGGSDCPPAVAPARYYEPKQILEHCDRKRHDYYSGWQDGAARASQFPNTHYLRIYETSDCPFPRCDKPCSNGQCGPCREAFVGMSATTELIESPMAPPAAVVPHEPIEQESIPPNSNQHIEVIQNPAMELTIPAANAIEHAPLENRSEVISAPQSAPTDDPHITIPLLPPLPATPIHDEQSRRDTMMAETATAKPTGEEEAPLIAIPGYRATAQWSRPAARPVKAQVAGFIRMVEPIKESSQTSSTRDGAEPIVIVDAPYQHFQMSDTETESKPIVKLVE